MENSAYMDSITAERSLLLTEEEQLAGATTISLETQNEFGEDDFYVYSREHFADWLRVLRNLSLEQQEMLLTAPLQRVHPAAQVHPVNLLCELLARRCQEVRDQQRVGGERLLVQSGAVRLARQPLLLQELYLLLRERKPSPLRVGLGEVLFTQQLCLPLTR